VTKNIFVVVLDRFTASIDAIVGYWGFGQFSRPDELAGVI
jgi:hypothetical protein